MNREDLEHVTNWHDPEMYDKALLNLRECRSNEKRRTRSTARFVELVLLFWWGVNPEGRAHITHQTIKDDTGFKSTVTIRNALQSLEASGRWITVRSSGGGDINSYYPQFIDNPLSKEIRDGHNPSMNHNPLL